MLEVTSAYLCKHTFSESCFWLLVPAALHLWAQRAEQKGRNMGLYDTAQTHQTGYLKLKGRFYRTFGKTYILLPYFHKLLKVCWEVSLWCRYQQISTEYLLSQKNVLVLKRWGWKFNTSTLAKMMFCCTQYWTLPHTVLAKCLGQSKNDNSTDLQNGRKHKTEQKSSNFPQLWVFATNANAHSIYILDEAH